MSRQIMIVGHESGSHYLIRRFAEMTGLEITQMIAEVQMIIVDMDPEPDWDMVRHIQTGRIPIVLCSWQGENIDLPDDICIEDHLQKPFLLRDFKAVLKASGLLD